MYLNLNILEKFKKYNAQVLVVTKYFSSKETQDIYQKLKNKKNIFGLGENRIEDIPEKNIPRNFCHYIGRLQSRKLKEIIKYCSVIHSLDKLKHAEKLNKILEEKNHLDNINIKNLEILNLGVFIQINISEEPKKGGILESEIQEFLNKLKKYKYLKILGFSGMGSFKLETDKDLKNKKQEFKKLIKIRNKFLPESKISAGTSIDYKIALKEGIDVIRVGRSFFKNP